MKSMQIIDLENSDKFHVESNKPMTFKKRSKTDDDALVKPIYWEKNECVYETLLLDVLHQAL